MAKRGLARHPSGATLLLQASKAREINKRPVCLAKQKYSSERLQPMQIETALAIIALKQGITEFPVVFVNGTFPNCSYSVFYIRVYTKVQNVSIKTTCCFA